MFDLAKLPVLMRTTRVMGTPMSLSVQPAQETHLVIAVGGKPSRAGRVDIVGTDQMGAYCAERSMTITVPGQYSTLNRFSTVLKDGVKVSGLDRATIAIYAAYAAQQAPPPTPHTDGPEVLKNVPGWRDYDYLDYSDVIQAMRIGEPLSYAQCQWLMKQDEKSEAFPAGLWSRLYIYAIDTCPPFAREQPKRLKKE
jgi:hypothetical protein